MLTSHLTKLFQTIQSQWTRLLNVRILGGGGGGELMPKCVSLKNIDWPWFYFFVKLSRNAAEPLNLRMHLSCVFSAVENAGRKVRWARHGGVRCEFAGQDNRRLHTRSHGTGHSTDSYRETHSAGMQRLRNKSKIVTTQFTFMY